jgi:NADH dehydrogenase
VKPRIVIVGGGYAGAYAARGLGDRADVTLISDFNYLLFTPMLAEVAAADIDPRHILAPLRHLCPHARVVIGTAVDVDFDDLRVRVRSPLDGAESEFEGDAIVIASGSKTATYGVPGVEEHCLQFRTISDALSIRHRVLGLLEEAAVRADPVMTTVAVVGAGAAGAELAASLADFLRRAARRYYRSAPTPKVVLLDVLDRVVPTLPEKASRAAERSLRKRRVEVVLGSRVAEVRPGAIDLENGRVIEAGTIVWAGGIAPRRLPGDEEDGRYRVDEQLRVSLRVWAAGDVADVPDGHGGISPNTAQHALRQGHYLGKHLPEMIAGRSAPGFRYETLGELVSLGHRNAVGRVFGVTVTGFIGWFLWRGYYLLRLPGILRKLRVAFDWTLDLVFPPDIADPPTAGRGPGLG